MRQRWALVVGPWYCQLHGKEVIMEKPDDLTSFIQQLEEQIELQEDLVSRFERLRKETLEILNAPRPWED